MLPLIKNSLYQVVQQQNQVARVEASYSTNRLSAQKILRLEDISLKQLKHPDKVIYSSAIAHQLAQSYSLPPASLAAQIADDVLQNSVDQPLYRDIPLLKGVLQDLRVQATASGLIQFEVSDRAIAAWLNLLVQPAHLELLQLTHFSAVTPQQIDCQSPEVFAVQFAHARCCSLLRLAHSTKLIALNQPLAHLIDWQFGVPNSVPWLEAANLRLTHLTERGLIVQLFAGLDEVLQAAPQRDTNAFSAAQALARSFQTFHSTHQFWQEDRTGSLDQRYAQLGLLLAVQRLLFLLLNLLNIDAPVEL